MIVRPFAFLTLFAFLLATASCYEPVQGCLDRAALNFDLDADEACPDNCCTYPQLTLEIRNRWGADGPDVSSEELYQAAGGQAFFLDRLRYYWSEPQLIQEDGSTLQPVDSVEADIRVGSDTVMTFVRDGIVLIDATQGTISRAVGTFRPEGDFIAIRVRLGLAPSYTAVLPGSLTSTHPLAFQPGRLYFGRDTGYAQLKLAYTPEGQLDSTTVTTFADATPLLIDIPVPGIASLPPGNNIRIVIEANYELLFSGLDLSASPEVLGSELVGRLPQIFRLIDVLAGP